MFGSSGGPEKTDGTGAGSGPAFGLVRRGYDRAQVDAYVSERT